MVIQVIQTNELTVPDAYNEYDSLNKLKEKYYEQCTNNPDKVSKEIRVIHSMEKS